MKSSSEIKRSTCRVLIVDDDATICTMLGRALASSYEVTTCTSGKEALVIIDNNDFDVIVTDLKMPEISGIEVLEFAKQKDEYTEVILMTGYGTLDSATHAINQGAHAYLLKPLQIAEFTIQVERAAASRLFHLRSLELMRQTDHFTPEVKVHLHEITSLYYFIRKLMLSLEIPEIMRITLDEALSQVGGGLAVIAITMHGFNETFVMPATADSNAESALKRIEQFREQIFPGAENKADTIPAPTMLKGRYNNRPDTDAAHPSTVPMTVAERTIGTLTIFLPNVISSAPQSDHTHYLHVFSSIVASVIEHGYRALQAQQQAKTDSLTGISNHRHFHESLDREISRATRKKSIFSLLLLDIDNFKKINDTYGHQVGDAVLINVTAIISSMIRGGDILARYGGEEFGIILPDTSLNGAEVLAHRIIQTIDNHTFTFSHHSLHYTVSIGLAFCNGTSTVEKDRLIAAADKALYYSKEHGKNRLSIGTITP